VDDVESDEEVTVSIPGKGEVTKKERRKVEMQVLHMSQESQNRAESALNELRGGKYKVKDVKSYKDQGQRLENRFWVRDRQLLVRGVHVHDGEGEGGGDVIDGEDLDGVSQFAVKKLEEYGFHTSRCVQALRDNDDDAGTALEALVEEGFGSGQDLSEEVDADMLEMYDTMREEEKLALESIYGEAFVERIPNKVWEIKLELKALLKHLPKENKANPRKDHVVQPKDACKFFWNGHCKFGRKCRQRHVQPEKVQKVEDAHLRRPEEENISFLEVRFRGRRRPYPKCAPIVAFRTALKGFPKHACLNMSKKLAKEANQHAADETPSIFALVSTLENRQTVDQAVKEEPIALCYNADYVPKELQESASEGQFNAHNGRRSAKGRKASAAVERRKRLDSEKVRKDDERLRKRFQERREDGKMMETRRSLPAWKEKTKILATVAENQVTIVAGDTGCGKSTQVPQYLIDEWLSEESVEGRNVICTQPRRISAVGVAERVASERSEKVGADGGAVGYQIRMETKASSCTRLLFCTTGILLRRLEGDSDLASVTHVVVDEVHERSEESDFLLLILRDLIK